MEYKGDFSIPFNEKNPLNYVKPITVNIYFKQQNPAVGMYNPKLVEKHVPSATHAFKTQTKRELISMRPEDINAPAAGQYEKIDGFDGKWRETDFGTRQFKEDVQRKIVPVNLYNPHAVPETDRGKQPGPQQYKVARLFDVPEQPEGEEFEPRLNVIPGGKVYVEQNMDRFGLPIRPMKPLHIVPGPGHYELQEPIYPIHMPSDSVIPGGFISSVPNDRSLKAGEPGVPGPAFYNSNKEPKKISFLFNPTEKWVQ